MLAEFLVGEAGGVGVEGLGCGGGAAGFPDHLGVLLEDFCGGEDEAGD